MTKLRRMAVGLWRLQTVLSAGASLVMLVAPERVFVLLVAQAPGTTEQVAVDMIRMTSIYPLALSGFSLLAARPRSGAVQRWFAAGFVGVFGMLSGGWIWVVMQGRYGVGGTALAATFAALLLCNLGLAAQARPAAPPGLGNTPSPPPGTRGTWVAQGIYWEVFAWIFVISPMGTIGRQVKDVSWMTALARDQTMLLGCWSVGFGIFCLLAAWPLRTHVWRGFAWLFCAFLTIYFPVFSSVALSGRYILAAMLFLIPMGVFLLLNARLARYYLR